MGIAKKPLQLKVVSGTAKQNPERLPEQEPQYETPEILPPPDDLCSIGKAKWVEIYPQILESGVLKTTDLGSFKTYCSWWAQLTNAQSLVRSQGIMIETYNGDTKKNPAFTAMVEASKELRAMEALFGLNPSARGGLDVGKKKSKAFTSRRR